MRKIWAIFLFLGATLSREEDIEGKNGGVSISIKVRSKGLNIV